MQLEWLSRIFGRGAPRRGRRASAPRREALGEAELLRSLPDPLWPAASEALRAVDDWPGALPPLPVASVPVPPVHSRADTGSGPRPALAVPPELPRSEHAHARLGSFGAASGLASGPAAVAVLIGVEGRYAGEVYKVRDGVNLIGRSKEAKIAFDGRDDTISREHAEIVHQQGRFALKALRKTNPCWVNDDEVVDGVPLVDGDRLRFGQSTFRFRTA